ncbi:MAG: ATP-binding protein [Candidatus Pacebacteria bacterium]|nr:ATP-binding protein [Candidatus Paceibacterota bacterium]
MDTLDIKKLWLAEEDEHFERKKNAETMDGIRKTICAFANNLSRSGLPGILLIGQNDDHSCGDLVITDRLKQQLTQHDNILPFPSLNLFEIEFEDCKALALVVHPSPYKPVDYDRTVYIRAGSSTKKATRSDLKRLEENQVWNSKEFELRPVNGSTINELNISWFKDEFLPLAINQETLIENNRDSVDWLRNQKFIDGNHIPTVIGMICAGKNPRNFLQGCFIQAVKFSGTINNPEDAIAQLQIQGNIAYQIKEAINLTETWNEKSSHIAGAIRKDRYAIPPRALREIIANAIIHRNYESNRPISFFWYRDRVEISNSGGPYGDVTIDNFADEKNCDYRNPVLASVVKKLGYIEQFGSGIGKAKREMNENGNPPIEFEPELGSTRVTLRYRTIK